MTTVNRGCFGPGFRLTIVMVAALWASAYAVDARQDQINGLAAQGQAPAYLALGDSYAHGSDGTESLPTNDNYYVAYPDFLHEIMDRPLVNAGCPGETTTSFLTGNPLDAGPRCKLLKDAGLLHVDYTGAQTSFAEQYLTAHDNTVLITLQLGGVDYTLLARQCRNDIACIITGLPAVEATGAANLHAILSRIRGAGYLRQIIYVEYPARNYNSPEALLLTHIYQSLLPVWPAHDVDVAPVFDRFADATEPYGGDSCAAGLLITNADGTCNQHPTEAGHRLIASIIAEMVTGSSGAK